MFSLFSFNFLVLPAERIMSQFHFSLKRLWQTFKTNVNIKFLFNTFLVCFFIIRLIKIKVKSRLHYKIVLFFRRFSDKLPDMIQSASWYMAFFDVSARYIHSCSFLVCKSNIFWYLNYSWVIWIMSMVVSKFIILSKKNVNLLLKSQQMFFNNR